MEVITIPYSRDNYAYLLRCKESGKIAIVDAGNAFPILDFLSEKNWKPDFILCTHHHSDHIAGNSLLKKKFPHLEIYAHQNANRQIPGQTHSLKDKDIITIGSIKLTVLETFGHTQSCISFWEETQKILFSGDCLFLAGCGRLLGGTAEQMLASLQKIQKLDPDTKIYFGHNYSIKNLEFALTLEPKNHFLKERIETENQKEAIFSPPTTLKEELKSNPFFRFEEQEIKANLEKKANKKFSSQLELFTQVRFLKDQF